MIAESKTSALAWTMSYVSLEIIPAAFPFLGLTVRLNIRKRDKRFGRSRRTILIQVFDNLREVLLRLLVEVRDGDTRSEYSVVWMLGGEIGGCLSGEVLKVKEMFNKIYRAERSKRVRRVRRW
jgi:hypothetical protein